MEIHEITESEINDPSKITVSLPVMDSAGELMDDTIVGFAADIQNLHPDVIISIKHALSFTKITGMKAGVLKNIISGIHFDSLPYTEILFLVPHEEENTIKKSLENRGLSKYL